MATGKSVAADTSESWKLLKNRKFEVKLGKSFTNKESNAFHTITYDFKPKSIGNSKPAKLKIDDDGVEVTVPSVQAGSSEDHTVFRGSMNSGTKECILNINLKTGEAVLDRVTNKVLLKVVREKKLKSVGKDRPVSPALPVKNPTNANMGTNSFSKKSKKMSKGKQPRSKKRAIEGSNPSQPKTASVAKPDQSRKDVIVPAEKKFLSVPTTQPLSVPTTQPLSVPTTHPLSVPTTQPLSVPTTHPLSVPTTHPLSVPTTHPLSMPTTQTLNVPTPQPWKQLEMPQKRPNPHHGLSSPSSSSSDGEEDKKATPFQQMSTFRPLSPVAGGGATQQPVGGSTDFTHQSSSSSSDSSSSDTDSSSDGSSHEDSDKEDNAMAPALPEHRSMSILNDDLGLSSSDTD